MSYVGKNPAHAQIKSGGTPGEPPGIIELPLQAPSGDHEIGDKERECAQMEELVSNALDQAKKDGVEQFIAMRKKLTCPASVPPQHSGQLSSHSIPDLKIKSKEDKLPQH